jgi:hypothetical protein
LGSFGSAVFAGMIAAWAGRELGVEWSAALSLAAVPVVLGLFNVMRVQVSSLFLAFGLCGLLWAYTPLSKAVEPMIERAAMVIDAHSTKGP